MEFFVEGFGLLWGVGRMEGFFVLRVILEEFLTDKIVLFAYLYEENLLKTGPVKFEVIVWWIIAVLVDIVVELSEIFL